MNLDAYTKYYNINCCTTAIPIRRGMANFLLLPNESKFLLIERRPSKDNKYKNYM